MNVCLSVDSANLKPYAVETYSKILAGEGVVADTTNHHIILDRSVADLPTGVFRQQKNFWLCRIQDIVNLRPLTA